MALRKGTIIDDTWVIERALGAGGMGSVYRAHNRHAPRIKAAIKMLSRELLPHTEARTRFVREAEILFGLDHPHIVKVRNVRLEHVPPYIEMEFIEGVSLYKMLSEPPFPFERALLFTEQLASAVRYLHRHNIYHRDIKPANLLIRKGATLKLVDFGLAVDVDDSERITQAGAHFGTVSYAPPEWIRPKEVDPKLWDIYAIGVILHEMLTGDTPFLADTGATPRQAAIQVMAVKQQLPFLDPGETYPDSLRELVRDLTVREPEKRVQDARDIVARLQRIQEELSFNANTVLAEGLVGDELQKAVHERMMEIHRPRTMHDGAPPRPVPIPEIPQVPVPAPSTAAAVPAATQQAPTSGRGGTRKVVQLGLAAVIGFVLTGGVAALTASALVGWRLSQRPTPRSVALLVTGVPRGTDVAVRIEDQPAPVVDGLTHRFEPVAPGTYAVAWSAGPGCAADPCPHDGCADTCRTGATVVTVPAGQGPLFVPLEIGLPEPRTLVVPVGDVPEGARVRLGDREAPVAYGAATLAAVLPGDHAVEVVAGTCPSEQRGCSDGGGCPPGCASRVVSVHVPALGEPIVPQIALEAPAPVPRAAPKRSGGGLPVTRSAFASWLASHPEWGRDRAIAEGRADASYLQGVDLAGDKPVVSVPWAAAQAYCAGRGGLATVGQAPLTWDEAATGLFQEWRSDEGAPAWRRYDGASSGQASQREANAFTGFRCR